MQSNVIQQRVPVSSDPDTGFISPTARGMFASSSTAKRLPTANESSSCVSRISCPFTIFQRKMFAAIY